MCSKKFEGDFNRAMERASCLVIINLDSVVLSLIYFSPRCFDLKDFNPKKPGRFEPLRKDSSSLPDQMSQMYVAYASKSGLRVLSIYF